MKKKVSMILLVVFLWVVALPAFAAGEVPRLVDNADLLTPSEEQTLLSTLDEISLRQQVDVVVVTVDSLGYKSPMQYADDFYDENGYSYDGVLLLVSMEERDWYISTCGYGITAFTDAGLEYISDQFLPDLSDGDYSEAFMTYAELCDEFITRARSGRAYDRHDLPRGDFNFLASLVIATVVGFAVAFIVTGVMRGQLQSVRAQSTAANYVKPGSMNVSQAQDLFLYHRVSRRPRPRDSSSGGSHTHRSSSGRSHGGRGGKF